MNFQQKLDKAIKKNDSFLCIGLDSAREEISRSDLDTRSDLVLSFNKEIIDATYDLVSCYKLNIAFYEAYGIEGLTSLKKTIEYLKNRYPEIPIILDAKRGDIGNTARFYAQAVFDYWDADAVTLTIFTGKEGIEPFLKYQDKFSFLYLRSSNKGAADFQDIDVGGLPFFQAMAEKVSTWQEENYGIIASATFPRELAVLRQIFPGRIFLVPGIGAQEGALGKTVEAGLNSEKSGLIIHSARSIIYAGAGRDFAKKARIAADKLKEEINEIRYAR